MEHFKHVSRSPFLPVAQFTAEFIALRVIKSDLPWSAGSVILCQFITHSAHACPQTDGVEFQPPIICRSLWGWGLIALCFHPGTA